jgi:hypothetical protein
MDPIDFDDLVDEIYQSSRETFKRLIQKIKDQPKTKVDGIASVLINTIKEIRSDQTVLSYKHRMLLLAKQSLIISKVYYCDSQEDEKITSPWKERIKNAKTIEEVDLIQEEKDKEIENINNYIIDSYCYFRKYNIEVRNQLLGMNGKLNK